MKMFDLKKPNIGWFALLAFLLPLAVYVIWRPYAYSGDDLQQSITIQERISGLPHYHPVGGRLYEPGLLSRVNDEALALPINPRYLLEAPTSILVARLWQIAGWQGDVITPVVTFRSIVGAVGALFLFLALYELRRRAFVALIASTGLALTASYWTYSTHVDQSINMVALLCAAFYALVRLSKTSVTWRGKIGLAIILVFASFYNFTAIISTLAFALAVVFLRPQDPWVEKVKQFVLFCLIYGAIAAFIIALAVAIVVSPAVLTDIDYWRGVLFAGKPEYNVQFLQDVFRAVLGLAKAQVIYPGVPGSLQDYWDSVDNGARALLLAYYGAVLLLLFGAAAILVSRRRHLPSGERWLWILLPSWFLLHSVFNWFWDPGFIKYWLIPLVCLWIVIALLLNSLLETRWSRLALAAALMFIGVSFALNWTTQFLPDSRREDNPWLQISEEMLTLSQPNDLFVSIGPQPLDFYLAYFTRRNIVSTALIAYDAGDDASTVAPILIEQMERHLADRGQVYIYGGTEAELTAVAQMMGITRDALEVAWEYPDLMIYRAALS